MLRAARATLFDLKRKLPVWCCRAVTSSGSAELIAVSSLFTYDGYWHYINPRATGKQLLLVSRILILVYTVLMGESLTYFRFLSPPPLMCELLALISPLTPPPP